jgi:cobalt-zinc-cadmium efflux system membrane fusion protein
VAAAAIIGATAIATVVVEHRIHAHDVDHEDEHDGHGHEEEHGEEHHDAVELTDAQLEEAGIELSTAGPGKVVVAIDLPGEIVLDAEATAHVGPRVGGTVRSISKKLGDVVNEGDVLAVLDSADVAEMQGELMAAGERLELAKANYERKKKLYDEKVISKKEFLAVRQTYAEAKVEVRSARRALGAKTGGSAGGAGYTLLAPISGTIVAWHIGVGEVIDEETRAFTISDLSSVWVEVTVYAKDLPRVRMGQRALVRAEGIADPTEGRISYLSHTVGRLTRSATARIVLDAPGEAWRPGLFVTAAVEIAEGDASVVVNEAAVQRMEGKHMVFVRDGDHIEARPVVLGRHGHAGQERVIEITRGLSSGERYVSKNSFLIKAELGKSTAGHHH